jgi:hypothetical protein
MAPGISLDLPRAWAERIASAGTVNAYRALLVRSSTLRRTAGRRFPLHFYKK